MRLLKTTTTPEPVWRRPKAAWLKTQLLLTKAETDLGLANSALTKRLVEIYKRGRLGVLDALVGVSSFSDLVNYLELMERLSEQDAAIVAQVTAYHRGGRDPQG